MSGGCWKTALLRASEGSLSSLETKVGIRSSTCTTCSRKPLSRPDPACCGVTRMISTSAGVPGLPAHCPVAPLSLMQCSWANPGTPSTLNYPCCSHRKKRMRQINKMSKRGLLDAEKEDPFSLFVSSTNIRYCFYKDTPKILGNTFGMCVLQVSLSLQARPSKAVSALRLSLPAV